MDVGELFSLNGHGRSTLTTLRNRMHNVNDPINNKSSTKSDQTQQTMQLKARFTRKSPAAKAVNIRSNEELEPVIEAKPSQTDNDTASTHSSVSDISPVGLNKVPEHPHVGNTLAESANKTFFLSLCCHGGSLPGDEDEDDIKEKDDTPRDNKEIEQDETFFTKLTGTFLHSIGQAPPQTVRCLEDRSVDGSELTIPQVLTDMAEEYDETRRQVEKRDAILKNQYERQQISLLEQKKFKLPLGSLMGKRASRRSTCATVFSNSITFEKRCSSRRKQIGLTTLYEI